MSDIFPIIDRKGNLLVNIKGEESYFYRIDSNDLEQMDSIEIENFYFQLSNILNNLDQDIWLKFYRINGVNYLNSNRELGLNLSLFSENKSLEVFFKANGFNSDIGFYDDYLAFNNRYIRLLSIKGFSEHESYPNFLKGEFDYCLSLKRIDNTKAKSKLDKIRSAHTIGLAKSKTDFNSEGAYGEAQDLLESLTHGYESLFEMELYILIDAYSVKNLNDLTNTLIEDLRLLGINTYIEGHNLKNLKTGLSDLFIETIPGVRPSFKYRALPNKTSHLVNLLPLYQSTLMDIGIELKDSEREKIYFNPFDQSFKNRNMLVTGESGGGKSVFVNKLVHSLIHDYPAVILDKGASFKRLSLYHSGRSIEDGINPMNFRCPYFLREFILSVVDLEKFKKLERGLLFKEITYFLEKSESTNFFELLDYLKTIFNGIDLYFEDIRGFITNKPLVDSCILYVDIENYPKSQIAPLVIYILQYFKALPDKHKILVMDECWEFLSDHSKFVEECFRTFRKSGAFPIAISQGISDFKSMNGVYSSILNNSHFKVYFPQDISEIVYPFDRDKINSLNYIKGEFSECYLKTKDNKYRKNIRVELSPLESELFHTEIGEDQNFYKFFNDYRKYFNSNKETIDSYVRLKYV